MITDVFLNQKRVNVCEHTVKMVPGYSLCFALVFRCARLGLVALAYLWRRDQAELLQEMIDCHIEAIVVKVAALGLDPTKHLGMTIASLQPHILKMVSHMLPLEVFCCSLPQILREFFP